MQFDCVEEIARQVGLPRESVTPVPFQKWQQKQCYMDGREEEDDAAVLPPSMTQLRRQIGRPRLHRGPGAGGRWFLCRKIPNWTHIRWG